ncbi:MAG: c-type cytochrome domain-containing protein [Anaerolineales bacterium]|nr:c-type cytochrome domain-containing protein [Anaerolineales bacterium]
MSKKPRTYVRFSLARRIEHLTMLLSFSTLGVTGLVQKYAASGLSIGIVNLVGGIENLRTIHHLAAIVMMFGTMYHILLAGYHVFVKRSRLSMLPALQDIKDGWQALKYNFGLAKSYPQMGRYTFEEKLEYWAFVWGTIVMGLTGFMMWNPVTTAHILPGEFIPAAKAAHGGEALLAVLAIIVWHMYGVHIKRFNKSIWTGKFTQAEMLHEHPLELADIKAGIAKPRAEPKTLRKRQVVYFPVAALLTVVMLAGVYGFIGAETTAITTVPPIPSPVPVYVPQTPTPMPLPAQAAASDAVILTWEGSIAPLFQSKCGACHGVVAGLSFGTYADALKGGASGAAILPGDAAASLVTISQQPGNHPGQFSPEELALVQHWIAAGAPEK